MSDQKLKDIMFQAQRDAGGNLSVNVLERVPYNEIWFVGARGHLLSKLTFPEWSPEKYDEISHALAEAVEFVNRKRREPVCSFWINENVVDHFKAILQTYEEEPIEPPAEVTEYEDDDDDTA